MSDLETFSIKGKRELSAFMAQEMLYDYVCGNLDAERKQAMDRYLEINRDLSLEAQRIKRGLDYLTSLGASKVDEKFTQQITIPTTLVQVTLQKTRFHEWPAGFRWALEAIFISAGIVVIAGLIPWHKLTSIRWSRSSEIVLTEISKTYVDQPEKEVATDQGAITYPDDSTATEKGLATSSPSTTVAEVAAVGAKAIATDAPKAADVPPTTVASSAASVTVPATGAAAQGAKLEAKAEPKADPTKAESKTESTTATPGVEQASETTAGKGQGFLWRGTISVTNVQAVTPKLVEKLVSLGGRKAGEVDLGWKKGNGSYFHFTSPEAKFEEVKAAFAEYGKLNIAREKHERVMPEGIIRLIITVSEKEGPKN